MIYLDTHVACWLYAGLTDRITIAASDAIAAHELLVSPMTLLEIQYLREIGRLRDSARRILETLKLEIGLQVCDLPFEQVADHALGVTWTRDPFDRIIVAQAEARGCPVVTKDKVIREHYPKVIW